jgi:hypothetical protein
MDMPPNFITYDQQLSPGMAIVAVWPNYTLLPQPSKLDAVAAQFGDPFQLSYWDQQHEGIKLTKEVEAIDVYRAFAKSAAGNAPLIISMPSGFETVIDAESAKKEFHEAVAEGQAALQSGAIYGAKFPAMGASWLSYLPYVALGAGLLFVGYHAVKYLGNRKPSTSKRR